MSELTVTWGRAARVYWAFIWRSTVFVLLPAAVAGFFFGILLAGNGISPEKHQWKLQVVIVPLSIVASIWIVKDILTSSMGTFRIALVPKVAAQPNAQADVEAPGGPAA